MKQSALKSVGRRGRRLQSQDRRWRSLVLERDHYMCRRCSKKASELHAHHILGKQSHPHLRHDVDNGITLCGGIGSCHEWAHDNPQRARSEFKT